MLYAKLLFLSLQFPVRFLFSPTKGMVYKLTRRVYASILDDVDFEQNSWKLTQFLVNFLKYSVTNLQKTP